MTVRRHAAAQPARWKWVVGGLSAVAALVSVVADLQSIDVGRGPFAFWVGRVERVRWLAITPRADTATAVGDTLALAASAADEHGAALAVLPVTWRSLDTAVATVDSAGLVVARGPGRARIEATLGARRAEAVVVVDPRAVAIVPDTALARPLAEGEARALAAEVRDGRGHGIARATVAWTSADTGVVQVRGDTLLGVAPGEAVVVAASGPVGASVRVRVAAAAAELAVLEGDGQRALAGRTLARPVRVRVLSASGRPLAGSVVQFLPDAPDASASPAADTTDAQGLAATSWRLGSLAGRQRLTVAADRRVATDLVADAEPEAAATRVRVQLPSDSGTVGRRLGDHAVVRVQDTLGRAIAGVPVAVTTEGRGTLAPPQLVTDSTGEAHFTWVLGPSAGRQRVRVQVGRASLVPPVTAEVVARADSAVALVLLRGDRQRAAAGTTLPAPVVLEARDAHGNAVAGAAVRLAPGAGSVPESLVVTDRQGRVSARWRLGAAAGPQELRARLGDATGASVRVTADAGPGAPATVAVEGAPASATAGRPLRLRIKVTDEAGNPVPDVALRLVPATGRVEPMRGVTGKGGELGVRWHLSPRAGPQSLRAEVQGHPVRATVEVQGRGVTRQAPPRRREAPAARPP